MFFKYSKSLCFRLMCLFYHLHLETHVCSGFPMHFSTQKPDSPNYSFKFSRIWRLKCISKHTLRYLKAKRPFSTRFLFWKICSFSCSSTWEIPVLQQGNPISFLATLLMHVPLKISVFFYFYKMNVSVHAHKSNNFLLMRVFGD